MLITYLLVACPLPGAYVAWRLWGRLGRDRGLTRRQRNRLWLHVGWHAVLLGLLLGIVVLAIMAPVGLLLEQPGALPKELRELMGFAMTMAVVVVMRVPCRWSHARLLCRIRAELGGLGDGYEQS